MTIKRLRFSHSTCSRVSTWVLTLMRVGFGFWESAVCQCLEIYVIGFGVYKQTTPISAPFDLSSTESKRTLLWYESGLYQLILKII